MKNIVIVGGSSGIGLELVKLFEHNNWNVIATYFTNPVEDREFVRYVHFNSLTQLLDSNDFPDCIDGLIYCPGVIKLRQFHRTTTDQFLEDYKIQVLGAINSIQVLLPHLKKSEQASIVLFSSIAASRGFKYHSLVSSSKGAIEGLSKTLAAEFAPIIRVNVIAPSITDTPLAQNFLNSEIKRDFHRKMNPLNKFGSPSDISELAFYLLSEKSSFITGQIFHIDGGISTIPNQ
jgi:NAD(P)-dependent dehydrogenase (short-subunit alcohol dehydrogenase family)